MKPQPLVHLPTTVMTLIPVITNSVIKAAHGEPPKRAARLARAIVHAQRLVDELKTAKQALEKHQRENDAA